jgi:putative ABC transport system substrate-binding protein
MISRREGFASGAGARVPTGPAARSCADAVGDRRRMLVMLAALAAAPLCAQAQTSPATRRIAWMGLGRPDAPSPYLDALRSGLRDLGWEEGRNITIGTYWSAGREDMDAVARQIAASRPEVIVTQELTVFAVQALGLATPVVFGFSGDPVVGKLVRSFARPGGNLTGMTYLALDLVGKRIELLKEMVPHMRRMAVLARPQHPGEQYEREASEDAAHRLRISLAFFPIRDLAELEKAFVAMREERCDSLVVFPDFTLFTHSARVARLAIEEKLPSVSGWAPFADNGMLLTYGPNVRDLYRALGRYVDRILRGAKPADLPVELPTTVELVVNGRTADALGVKIPPSILVRADKVIE